MATKPEDTKATPTPEETIEQAAKTLALADQVITALGNENQLLKGVIQSAMEKTAECFGLCCDACKEKLAAHARAEMMKARAEAAQAQMTPTLDPAVHSGTVH